VNSDSGDNSPIRQSPAAACVALRAQGPTQGAPADLGVIARRAGIAHVELADLPVDGLLRSDLDGRKTALIARAAPRVRQRYTLAHEAGHAVLGTDSGACFIGGSAHVAAERDADRFAAEALMPADQFIPAATAAVPGAAELATLAGQFIVSTEAAALRVCELGLWDVAIVVWRRYARPGSTEKLRVDWSTTIASRHVYVPKYVPAPAAIAALEKSAVRSQRVTIPLRLGSLRRTYDVDTLVRSGHLISVVLL
jgi:hypothetical protein